MPKVPNAVGQFWGNFCRSSDDASSSVVRIVQDFLRASAASTLMNKQTKVPLENDVIPPLLIRLHLRT